MTGFDPEPLHRRSIRLPGYDYAQAGAYFVTVCIRDRACLLGDVVDGLMQLSPAGRVVQEQWFRAVAIRPNVSLEPDEFVVMPNHIHGIIRIIDNNSDRRGEASPGPEHTPHEPATDIRRGEALPRPEHIPHERATDIRRGEALPRPDSPPHPRYNEANAGRGRGDPPGRPYDSNGAVRTSPHGPIGGSIGAILGQFKSVTAKVINRIRNSPGAPVWQRNYYEHVIRDEIDLDRIRHYIVENPARWAEDAEHPDNLSRRHHRFS